MQIINSYGYINVIVSVIIFGLIIDIIIHLAKQMKNTGEWRIDFSSLAVCIIGIMLIMSYFTRALREDITVLALIIIWVFLLCYLLLRNLKKYNK